eukprot:TRINITY_DN8800_c1_g1_i1.p1 TRINITY_DN8800_c1_g1~~TRINITY_DN8800_c1_g1_i1.p1  ORF type:complete len:332 (+),score=99.98 TRINITY_DN8800_c1_g1_i1:147-1142(+)
MPKKRDKEDAHGEDANPMNKSLPGEIIRRSHKGGKNQKDDASAATNDRKAVFAMKPDQRVKWLQKALQQAEDSKFPVATLFDIIGHPKYVSDLQEKVGGKMFRMVRAKLEVFSAKQQKNLPNCPLFKQFGQADAETATKQEAAAAEANAMEEMMARCRNFVREKQAERGERGEYTGPPVLPPEPEEEEEEEEAPVDEAAAHATTAGDGAAAEVGGNALAENGAEQSHAVPEGSRSRSRGDEKVAARTRTESGDTDPGITEKDEKKRDRGSHKDESRSRSRSRGKEKKKSRKHSSSRSSSSSSRSRRRDRRSGKKRSRSRGDSRSKSRRKRS